MGLGEIIAIIVTALIISGAVAYIIKAKKSGQKCIGCPYSKACGSAQNGACSCCCGAGNKENKSQNSQNFKD